MAAVIKAGKQNIVEPIVGWEPHDDRRIVFYGLNREGLVLTTAGPMERVRLSLRAELGDPAQDVAAHVGWVLQKEEQIPGAYGPELWFWGEGYWLKARVSGKGDWYHRGSYLLYRVMVIEPPGYIGRLTEERDQIYQV